MALTPGQTYNHYGYRQPPPTPADNGVGFLLSQPGAAMAVNDVWQVTSFHQDGASTAQTVRHYRITTQVSETEIEFVEAMDNALGDLYEIANDYSSTASAKLVCLTFQKVSGDGSRIYPYFFAAAVGTASGEANAAQLAILISLYSETNQPYARGRWYWPFPAETLSVGGILDASLATNFAGAIADLLAVEIEDSAGNIVTPVVWSRKTSMAYDIVDAQIRPVLATQRRRREPTQPFVP